MNIEPIVLAHIKVHAKKVYPSECCGLIIIRKGVQQYWPCDNQAEKRNEHFILNPRDYAKAADEGEVVMVVHSHPNTPPRLSEPDKVAMGKGKLPWLVINWPVGNWIIEEPEAYTPPLVGREFAHGILDCYSIVRDYYKQEFNIEVPDHFREDGWWDQGGNMYLDNVFKDGWLEVPIEEMRKHDFILMKVMSPVPNHSAIYLGDNIILHHLCNRLSSRDVYGGYYRKNTTHVLRWNEHC